MISYCSDTCAKQSVTDAPLNRNIHTSFFSHAVNYSHEYVTFRYVWNIRTTNFEILIRTSFPQMSNFRRVKNSHVFVIPVKNSFAFFTCDKYVRILHTCNKFVRMWKPNEYVISVKKFERMCHTCEEFVRIFHRCEKYVRFFQFCEGLARFCFTSVIRMQDYVQKS